MTAERARPLTGALLILIGFFALVHAALGAELPAESRASLESDPVTFVHAPAPPSDTLDCAH